MIIHRQCQGEAINQSINDCFESERGIPLKVISVVGARPNFMKVAPVHSAFLEAGFDALLVHTGQHYDEKMSQVFFDQLGMPRPDVNLHVGSGSHAVQTARVMEAFEKVVQAEQPDVVLVAGDVNSTIACALVSTKLGVKVAHLEAGLRSYDRAMPEEINRVLTDQISDVLLTPSADGDENLAKEGIESSRVVRVGNAMIDSLLTHLEHARSLNFLESHALESRGYGLLTLHRPSNVDVKEVLEPLLEALCECAKRLPIVFPAHPRTRKQLTAFGLWEKVENTQQLKVVEPLGYLEFLALQSDAKVVMTDSGGIQEETTALGVPCLTIRENTERPITITEGTNTLVGVNPENLLKAFDDIMENGGKTGQVPEFWDGKTAQRVVKAIREL